MLDYDRDFSDTLRYDETSTTFLRWKSLTRSGRNGFPSLRKNKGEAGCRRKDGGYVVTVDGYPHSTKYIVWSLFNGSLSPGQDIGFTDGDCSNCSINNLYVSEKVEYKDKYGEHLKDFFEYDEESPSGIRWKKIYARGSNVRLGDIAGGLDEKDGYWRVHALGTHLKAHKIVWALFNSGSQDGLQVDHRDGNRGNNKIGNLRLVERVINQRNRCMNKNNTTSVNGVTYSERMQPSGLFSKYSISCYNSEGKKVAKSFSVQKFGKNRAFHMACEWREKMVAELNANGHGFTDRHGKYADEFNYINSH